MRKGFTLIELLVTVLVTSIVVLAAYTMVSGTAASFRNENDRGQLLANLRAAQMMIQRDIGRIGYRAAFDSEKESIHVLGGNILAFNVGRVQVGGRHYSEFTLVGDLTDYTEFTIRESLGNQISVDNMGLGSIQSNGCLSKIANRAPGIVPNASLGCMVGSCDRPNCSGVPPAPGLFNEDFEAAFMQSFDNIWAIRLTSISRDRSVIVALENPLDQELSSLQLKLADPLPTTPELGFAVNFTGDELAPISAISYGVHMVDINGDGNRIPCLLRCFRNPIMVGDSNLAPPTNCSILLRNVQYFDVLPLHTDMTAAQQTDYETTLSTSPLNYGAMLPWMASPPRIENLTGITFRIGVLGEVPITGRTIEQAQITAAGPFPPFLIAGPHAFNYVHIQGNASLFSRSTATGTRFIFASDRATIPW
ncbi:MAG: prepilin-type N-terminal cleavage/methylation domain-containing protein [Proteobacteria bacterium]|nr:prepilin-type N-terminal cleavage/methylation domain-containing protein [Pseudomonadota bacterium]